MSDDEQERRRAQFEAEERFIEERGGRPWLMTYVAPLHLTCMGLGLANRAEARATISEVRSKAFELDIDVIQQMLVRQWRIQLMGTWYAIARSDGGLAAALHGAFDFCFGTLTAPALTTGVLTYPTSATAETLRRYRDRDIEHQYGASGIVDAALRRLDPGMDSHSDDRDDDALDSLLNVARQLQDPN